MTMPAAADGGLPSALDKLTQRDRLYDVAMQDDNVWVVGFPGIILHSPDAGRTWEAQAGGGSEALFSVEFVNAEEGWIVGRNGLVLHTADGGANWTNQGCGHKAHLFDVDFVDSMNGWAVGNFGTVVRTTDGGKTWTKLEIKLEDEDGEIGGDDQADDDWLGEDEEEEEEEPFDRLLNGVAFVDSATGWIAGESGVILHTEDGGKSWTVQDSDEWTPLYAVTFTSPQVGFVAGSEGMLFSTTDGGEVWEKAETKLKDHLFKVIVAGGHLYAVGRRGLLVRAPLARKGDGKEESGALSPERIPLGIYTWLASIAMSSDGVGVLVGGQGLIMRTTDNGKTWDRLGR